GLDRCGGGDDDRLDAIGGRGGRRDVGGDADDRVDPTAALGEVGIVIDVNGNALLFSRTHDAPSIGITAMVMLSWPPASNANSVSARAASAASASLQNRAMSAASG